MLYKKNRKFEISSKQFPALLIRLGIVLLFYIVAKIVFICFNSNLVVHQAHNTSYWIYLFLGSIRFDLSIIFTLNFPFIVLSLLPFRFIQNLTYRKIVLIVFYYIPNISAFLADFIDIIYSKFTQKRMTYDVFRFVKAGDGFFELIPSFITDFWYIFLIFFVLIFLFIGFNQKLKITTIPFKKFFSLKYFILMLMMTGVCIIGIRGGFQLRPIGIINASKYAESKHYILVLNTPFTLMRTINNERIEDKRYFDSEKLTTLYKPIYKFSNNENFINNNVVIIILEGVTAEYSALLNNKLKKSYTPVLDSIASKGKLIKTYANGTRSMEGIPAILAGLPTLMDNEYITSSYSENKITSLPILLKTKGYKSAFFHGGKNGTMNFNSFADVAGFDYYYGKNEYNNDTDYDGTWGIFDEKFLKYFAKQLDTIANPFLTSVFLLSSHHPYTLPKDYKEQYNISEQNMKTCVTYSDWALGEFFKIASTKPWFEKTLFVIISDHASKSEDPYYNTQVGKYEIPMILYHPKQTISEIQKPFVQQIDVMPTVLDILNFQDSIFSFGNSAFDNEKAYAINYINNIYQLMTDEWVVEFNGVEIIAVYDKKNDIFLKNNLLDKISTPINELNFLKAFIQTYNTSLIYNKLTIESYEK